MLIYSRISFAINIEGDKREKQRNYIKHEVKRKKSNNFTKSNKESSKIAIAIWESN